MKGDIKVLAAEIPEPTRAQLDALAVKYNKLNAKNKRWGGYNCIGNASDACGKVARLFGVQNWTMADFRLLDSRATRVSHGYFIERSALWFANELANWQIRREYYEAKGNTR